MGGRRRQRPQPGHPADAPGAARPAPVDWRLLTALAALVVAVLLAYYPAWHGGPVWDDDAHLTPPDLRSTAGLWRIWFEVGATQQYYPLVHSTFWLLHRLVGEATTAYHLLNIALHACSATLLALLLRKLDVRGAVLAAVIFALHPVQVESVAWMTELKNTLSGVFYLAAALTYLSFDEGRRARAYVGAFLLFAAALSSKTVTATLPAALLVVFWWRRGQLAWRRDIWPLLPFFVTGAAAGGVTAWVERTIIGASANDYPFTFIERTLIAGRALWFYVWKLAWPVGLTFNYPRWSIDQGDPAQYLYPLGIAALAWGLWRWRRRSRAPLAAFLLFAGTLFPALGFVNVYPFRYSFVADHFQYLAMIGPVTLVSAWLSGVAGQVRARPTAARLLVVATAATLATLTWRESRQYVSAETLYVSTIERNPSAVMAHINLGLLYLDGPASRWARAIEHLSAAVALRPDYAEARVNLGAGLQRIGQLDEAATEYREALRLDPDNAAAHNNLGAVLEQLDRLDEALDAYAEAVRLDPGGAEARANLGRLHLVTGRPGDAVLNLEMALRVDADNAGTRYLLGAALAGLERFDEAVAEYQRAISSGGAAMPELHNDLGVALAQLGRLAEAERHFVEALRLSPDFDVAQANLAAARAAAASPR